MVTLIWIIPCSCALPVCFRVIDMVDMRSLTCTPISVPAAHMPSTEESVQVLTRKYGRKKTKHPRSFGLSRAEVEEVQLVI